MDDLFSRRLVPSPQALGSAVGDETVILHLGNATYFGLDEVGTRTWGLLKEDLPLPAVLDRLLEEYEAEPAVIEADMRRFLDHLLDHDLLIDA